MDPLKKLQSAMRNLAGMKEIAFSWQGEELTIRELFTENFALPLFVLIAQKYATVIGIEKQDFVLDVKQDKDSLLGVSVVVKSSTMTTNEWLLTAILINTAFYKVIESQKSNMIDLHTVCEKIINDK